MLNPKIWVNKNKTGLKLPQHHAWILIFFWNLVWLSEQSDKTECMGEEEGKIFSYFWQLLYSYKWNMKSPAQTVWLQEHFEECQLKGEDEGGKIFCKIAILWGSYMGDMKSLAEIVWLWAHFEAT